MIRWFGCSIDSRHPPVCPSHGRPPQRDRRKLHIEPLHLPPEGVRALTEDVEKGKKKKGHASSAAAMLCATSGGAAGGGGLDF